MAVDSICVPDALGVAAGQGGWSRWRLWAVEAADAPRGGRQKEDWGEGAVGLEATEDSDSQATLPACRAPGMCGGWGSWPENRLPLCWRGQQVALPAALGVLEVWGRVTREPRWEPEAGEERLVRWARRA